jgi:hypothetical protein
MSVIGVYFLLEVKIIHTMDYHYTSTSKNELTTMSQKKKGSFF